MTITYSLEPESDRSSCVHLVADLQLKGAVARLVGPFAKGRMKRYYMQDAAVFKRFVEGKYGDTAAPEASSKPL